MKKGTKNKIMVGFIILIFVMSSIAFAVFSFTGQQSQAPVKQLDSFIIDGEVDSQTEYAYIQNGFTFLRYYYNSTENLNYIESLPQSTRTASGQTQLFVEKIESESNYATINSPLGYETVENITQGKIFSVLCERLIVTPPECSFLLINMTK